MLIGAINGIVKPLICLVTPALASANNGNWQTAARWRRMLSGHYRVELTDRWDGRPADAMIALHARRSAASIEAWAARRTAAAPLVVVLTGTDLYRDIAVDASARRSLELADRLVVLQEQGPLDVPVDCRHKVRVCFQSCGARQPVAKTSRHLRALAVGHLREEKDPATLYAAVGRLLQRTDILVDHIGAALDPELGRQARALMATQPRYRWLGSRPHAATRAAIQRAHVLVHASRMEGGAHVVMEAVRSGTPVIASRVPGNVGMLGVDYAGYFEPGDDAGLARCLGQARDDAAMLAKLQQQCALRSALFAPATEQRVLLDLLNELLRPPR